MGGGDLSAGVHKKILNLLLSLAEHPLPESDQETEESFARSPSWSAPCPRIRAAEALARILPRADLWPQTAPAVERLVRDPHPAVRMMVVKRLNALWGVARDDMWRLVEFVAATEQNAGVNLLWVR